MEEIVWLGGASKINGEKRKNTSQGYILMEKTTQITKKNLFWGYVPYFNEKYREINTK